MNKRNPENHLKDILKSYVLPGTIFTIEPVQTGLINHTWKISGREGNYILQRINTSVFTRPLSIASNLSKLSDFLTPRASDYLFVSPLSNRKGEPMVKKDGQYFRLFPFIPDSHSIQVVESPGEAFEAARQFGLFTYNYSDFPVEELQITLPDFHNLSLRYHQFKEAIQSGNPERIKETRDLSDYAISNREIVETFEFIRKDPAFKLRVTHHDTKISNVLFDSQNRGLCVIDLDTVMPGYFISDVGDMLRTYLSAVPEEGSIPSQIQIRDEFFQAVWKGYMSAMGPLLSEAEKQHFIYGGAFMIYMQALRFLTDYLNGDTYYKITYFNQNLVRARNQFTLLERLLEKKSHLEALMA